MEKKFSLLNALFGWLAFVGSAIVYILTMEPTVSLWDCGEFIATAAKLEVGHPPGAPLFLMLGRFFALFANDASTIAYCINTLSALASAATIMFLFWTITHLARKFFDKDSLTASQLYVVIASGIIGAAAYTFTDTFWFSAVEGEVYALSSLFTAVVFWAILKWENVADKPHADKWLILIAYIMGLSIGVHLLNLLTITAIVYVYYFKKYTPTTKGIILAGLLSLLIIAFMMWGIITGSMEVASQFELFFVNVLGLPFHSGLIAYIIVLIGALTAGIIITKRDVAVKIKVGIVTLCAILMGMPFMSGSVFLWLIILSGIIALLYYVAKQNPVVLNTIVNIMAVVMIGYSSYAMIIIRSNANTPMNENAPDNVFSLLSYLNREQYGKTPLVYGPYYNAAPEWKEDNTAKVNENFTYTPRDGKYVKVSNGIDYVFNSQFCTIFPRMHSREPHHIKEYKDWAGIKDGVNTRKVFYEKERQSYNVPTFGQNLKFFFSYQIGHMYVRYFMWNFAGRQNDVQSHGGIINGNWISGIPFIDNQLVGDQTHISEKAKNNPTRNTYYLLPFALGIIGFLFHVMKRKRDSLVVVLLFVLTGLAIVVFLNQTPYQPRERDYAYAGSFYAFSIWIGLSVLALYYYIKKYLKHGGVSATIALLIAVPTPIVLASENWQDHNRSGRYTARDFAYNYLMSCDPNALIVTAGDNDTFPLWYIQEVEGVRTDVRVLCTPLLATDWYSQQMMRRSYESAPLPLKLTEKQVAKGIRDIVRVQESSFTQGKYVLLSDAMEVVRDDEMKVKLYGDSYNYMPASLLKFPVNKKQVLAQGIVSPKDSLLISPEIRFEIKDKSIYKNKLVLYDVLDGYQWNRPLYYTNQMSAEEIGLEKYTRYDGFVFKFVPIESANPRLPHSDTDVMYNNLMNVYKWGGMGDSTVHMCHFNERTTRVIGIRSMFNQLAMNLASEGKKDSARAVLAKLKTIMPDWQFPYFDDNIIYTAYAYYAIGDNKGAQEELSIYVNNLIQEIAWFNSLQPQFASLVQKDKEEYMRSLVQIADVVQSRGDTKFMEKLEFEWKQIEQRYTLQQILMSSRNSQ